jgi:O-antigen/teichoic acid export membrane protein
LLTPAEYGLADLANTLAALLAMLAMFAGDIPAARLAGQAMLSANRRTILSSYVWMTALAGLVIAVALLPFSSSIVGGLWNAPGNAGIFLLTVALIPVSTIQASLITTLRLEAKAVSFAVLATIDLLAQMILAVLFVALGLGPAGMVAGLLFGSLIGLAAVAISTRSLIAVAPSWRLGRAMVAEGVAFLPAALGFVMATYAVRFLLVDSQGQDAVGLFGVATRLAGGMALVTGAFSMAWGPFGLALPDNLQTARLFGRVMRRYAFVAVLASLSLGALGPELVSVVSGDDYVPAGTMLPGLLIAAAMAGAFYVLLVAAGISRRGGAVAIAAVTGAVLQVLLTALLLPFFGFLAVGFAAMTGQALALTLLVVKLRSSVHGGVGAVLVMCAGGLIGLGVQMLNEDPTATFAIRLGIALASTAIAAGILLRLVQRPSGTNSRRTGPGC